MNKEILYFSSTWCQPCRQLGPIMESLKNQINYRKIDVDQQQGLVTKYGVRNIPTLILVENGEVKNRKVGGGSKNDIINFYNS